MIVVDNKVTCRCPAVVIRRVGGGDELGLRSRGQGQGESRGNKAGQRKAGCKRKKRGNETGKKSAGRARYI